MGLFQPFAFLQVGWKHRHLIRRMAWRQIESGHRGSVLGWLWTIINPLLMLCVYTFVFSVVFRAKWNLPTGENGQFALFLFSGLILYNIFAHCVNSAPRLILSNRLYVKQVLFPIEILSWVSLAEALFNFTVSFAILAAFYLVFQGVPPVSILFLPLIILPLLLFSVGSSWLLSSLGVFLSDIAQVVGVLTMALLFMSPIFYPASRIPEEFQPYYFLNPLATVLEMAKGSLFYGVIPDWKTLLGFTIGAWGAAWLGYVWFMKTKKGFADVL